MGHVILLGDSIFDNGGYVPGGPSVVEHLRKALPAGWRATLLAVDGSGVENVARQLAKVPADATHLVVSAGGNNALDHSSLILHESAKSFAEVLSHLEAVRAEFQQAYRDMLEGVLALRKPVVVCTVYDAIPDLSQAERAGLSLFNDCILREAFRAGVPVIDLRVVCHEPTDFAPSSPIEPSVAGGGKIARVIARALAESETKGIEGTRVFA